MSKRRRTGPLSLGSVPREVRGWDVGPFLTESGAKAMQTVSKEHAATRYADAYGRECRRTVRDAGGPSSSFCPRAVLWSGSCSDYCATKLCRAWVGPLLSAITDVRSIARLASPDEEGDQEQFGATKIRLEFLTPTPDGRRRAPRSLTYHVGDGTWQVDGSDGRLHEEDLDLDNLCRTLAEEYVDVELEVYGETSFAFAVLDALDAETEGGEMGHASALARFVLADRYGRPVSLFDGFPWRPSIREQQGRISVHNRYRNWASEAEGAPPAPWQAEPLRETSVVKTWL